MHKSVLEVSVFPLANDSAAMAGAYKSLEFFDLFSLAEYLRLLLRKLRLLFLC